MTTTKRARKAKPSIGPQLIERMTRLRDALRSDEPLATRFTVRTVSIPEDPEPYSADDVRSVRMSLQVSQAVFAALVGVSPKLVQAWEQGGREPSRTVRRLLDDIRRSPDRWRQHFGLPEPIPVVRGRVPYGATPVKHRDPRHRQRAG